MMTKVMMMNLGKLTKGDKNPNSHNAKYRRFVPGSRKVVLA